MAETYQLRLPLLAPAQAQKHVTVNEALTRIDALLQLRVAGLPAADPPPSPVDGQAYLVGLAATGEWAGKSGMIAIAAGGGWDFVEPRAGWTAWAENPGVSLRHDGAAWQASALTVSPSGAGTICTIREAEVTITPGTTVMVSGLVPAQTIVLGVTGRVTEAITGTIASWRLGVSGSTDRYGSGLGKALGSYALGLTGSPVTYYTATDLLVTADGGAFAAGKLVLSVHGLGLTPPRSL